MNYNFIGNDARVRYGDGENTHCIIDSCNFINNGNEASALQIVNGAVKNSYFESNHYTYGAAILSYVNPTVENCRFLKNKATEGEDILHYGLMTSDSYEGMLKIINSTFTDSTANEFRNAIYAYCSECKTNKFISFIRQRKKQCLH